MKKKFFAISICLLFVLITFMNSNVFATTHTLEEVKEKFNNSSSVKQYLEYGYEFSATIDEEDSNKLNVLFKAPETDELVTSYTLEGSILSCDNLKAEEVIRIYDFS